MEQILITRANSTVELINSSSTITSIISAEHRKSALGEDVVVMSVEMAVDRAFSIGDSIKLFDGNTYKINQLPSVEKISERQFRYDLVFEGIQYDLLRVLYKNEDVSTFSTSAEFALTGDIEMFLNVLINNANRVFGANKWVLGDFPSNTETKNLLFSNENCLNVLQRICSEYSYEFTFTETSTQKILNVKSLGSELDFTFEYGKGKGLYNLKRDSVDSKKIINKLFAYGSTKNIPANYKNFSQRLHFGTVSPLTDSVVSDATSIANFGVCEGSIIFDDVFPTGYNSITAINTDNRLEFTDTSMSFDLNAKDVSGNTLYLIPSVSAKIHFNTGNLAGYEFEVEKYTHATKKFILKPVIDEKGFSIPSLTESAFFLSVGDNYSLLDIVMPQSLIDAAESLLQSKAVDYLNVNKAPIVKYSVAIDEVYLKEKTSNLNVFDVGDSVIIKDSDFSINTRIKIISFSRNILYPYRYSIVVSDIPEIGVLRALATKSNEADRIIRHNGFNDPTKFKQDPNSNNQIQSQIDETINRKPSVIIGRDSTDITIGNNQSLLEILGRFGIRNADNYLASFSVADLTEDVIFNYPNNAVLGEININDYNYLINKPTTFPAEAHTHTFASLSSKPTTISGFGITDFETNWQYLWVDRLTNFVEFGSDVGILGGLGVSNALFVGGAFYDKDSYAGTTNQVLMPVSGGIAWSYIPYSAIIGKPTTFPAEAHTHTFDSLSSKPTTISGFGITDYNSLFDTRFASKIAASVTFGSNIVVEGFRTNQNAFFYANTIFYGDIFDKNNSTGTTGKILTPASGGGVEWSDIAYSSIIGKPTTFTPTAHTHTIGEITDLSSALAGKQPLSADLTAIDALSGTTGLLKKTATDTWVLDTTAYLSANQSISITGDATGSGTTSIALTLATVATAGTYRSVTVNAKGLVTAGTNPTTISGYGITDFNYTFDSRWATKILSAIGFGSDISIEGFLAVGGDFLVQGDFYDKNVALGTANQVLMPVSGGVAWTSLSTAQISNFSANVLGQVLTGYTTGSNTALSSSDTVLTAFQNLQAQVNTKGATANISGTISYLPKFISSTAIGDSFISDTGTVIAIGDVGYGNDIVEGRKINLNYPVYFGNSRIYDNADFEGTAGLTIDTNDLFLDVDNVKTYGRYVVGDNYLVLRQEQLVEFGAFTANIDALYSELKITSSKTNIIGSLGISVIEGISLSDVTANNLWNFTTLPQVTTDATIGNQLVRLSQVQSLLSGGFSVSTACKLAFITDQSLSGSKTQGGYTTVTGDNILLTGQSSPSANGVYVFDGSNWARNTANDTDTEIRGKGHLIINGTYANTQWVNNNSSTITVGSTAITYVQWSGAELDPVFTAHAAYGVTTGLISNWDVAFANYANRSTTLTISTNTARITGGGVRAIDANRQWDLDLAFTGISAGTYLSVSVDLYGRVTAGTNAISISSVTSLQATLDGKQTIDPNLTAISALSTIGFIKRTGSGTYGIDTTSYLPLTGGTMTGSLLLRYSVRIGGTSNDDDNLFFGKSALVNRSTGLYNTAIGASAGSGVTTGSANTFLGYTAGSSITTGSSNIIIGAGNTGIQTGSNNVIIGRSISGLSSSLANNIIIADGQGNRRINVGSSGLVGFGLTSPAYRVDVSGDVNVTGMYRLNGSIGADHTFLKSNGTTQEWSLLTVGEISDIASTYLSISSASTTYAAKADAVLYGTYDGERGFKLYHDSAKLNSAALFFANQDTGIIGIHAYGLNDANALTEFGIQIQSDAVYHKKADGTRARFLTTDDSLTGGGSSAWNGGTVTNPITMLSSTNMQNARAGLKFARTTGGFGGEIFLSYGYSPNGLNIISNTSTDINITAGHDENASLSNPTKNVIISGSSVYINGGTNYIGNMQIDTSNIASLVGGNAKFAITALGSGKYKATLVSG